MKENKKTKQTWREPPKSSRISKTYNSWNPEFGFNQEV